MIFIIHTFFGKTLSLSELIFSQHNQAYHKKSNGEFRV